MNTIDDHLLDNIVWHSLTGAHAGFAEGGSRARRYVPDVNTFAACDRLDDDDVWDDFADLVGPDGVVVLFQPGLPPAPRGWRVVFEETGHQMVLSSDVSIPAPASAVERLSTDDRDAMMALTSLTKPGPFFPRTHELGTYLGVKRGGALIAMAGERFSAGEYTEISAVCTEPGSTGQGLGATLTLAVAGLIRERGATPMLHVLSSNDRARSLYEHLGFLTRRLVDVRVYRRENTGQNRPASLR